MESAAEPNLRIDDDVKMRTLQMVIATIDREFRAASGRPPSADDVLDFYALAIGALFDADTNLRSEADMELATLTASAHILSRLTQMRASHDANGRSFYEVITAKLDELHEQMERPH